MPRSHQGVLSSSRQLDPSISEYLRQNPSMHCAWFESGTYYFPDPPLFREQKASKSWRTEHKARVLFSELGLAGSPALGSR